VKPVEVLVEVLSVSVFPSDAVQVNPAAEIGDGAIQVDATVVGQGLGLEPSEVLSLMQEGAITSSCERGIEDDAGRYRLIFFYKSRRQDWPPSALTVASPGIR
jgi:Family of unknown function (DUF6522)